MPVASVSMVMVAEPISLIVTPDIIRPKEFFTVPRIKYVTAAVPVKFWAVTFALLMVTFLFTGLNEYPAKAGATV